MKPQQHHKMKDMRKMKKHMKTTIQVQIIAILLLLGNYGFAQGDGVKISTNNNAPHPSAMLEIESVNKGLLIPRMATVKRDGINLPENSLLIFNTTTNQYECYDSSTGVWKPLAGTSVWQEVTNGIKYDGGNVGILADPEENVSLRVTAPLGAVTLDKEIIKGSAFSLNPDYKLFSGESLSIFGPSIVKHSVFYVKTNGDGFFAGKVGIGVETPTHHLLISHDDEVHDIFRVENDIGRLEYRTLGLSNVRASILRHVGQKTDDGGGVFTQHQVIYSQQIDDGTTTTTGIEIATFPTFGSIENEKGSLFINTPNGSTVFDDPVAFIGSQVTFISDSTLKENIQPMDGTSMLNKILQCNGYTYKFKNDDSGELKCGVLAQELELQFPSLVKDVNIDKENLNAMAKGVDYNGLISVLLESIKEQQAIINALEARIETLENQ